MAGNTVSNTNTTVVPSPEGSNGNHTITLSALTMLFFMWGFITCLNDILIPHLKGVFSLSYTQAMLVQFCFFGAYVLVSLPAGSLIRKIGYKKGIVSGLLVSAIGCLLFYPAASAQQYWMFLGALFVLASGITLLQVSANPYVTALGKPETASSRLTFTQGFNSLGTTVAPFFGGMLILAGADAGAEMMEHDATTVQVPYLILAASLCVLAVLFAWLKLPEITTHTAQNDSEQGDTLPSDNDRSAWSHRHLVLGAVAIFVYVGAEVSIGSFLINFIGQDHIAGFSEGEAAYYIAYYWGGAMVGRFIGAAVMQKIRAGSLLAFNSLAACVLLAIAVFSDGHFAMWSLLAVGLCNSIMFPTIFSLGVNQLGAYTSQGSGVLCVAIVGGALIPVMQGIAADLVGIQLAFLLPILCYLYIAFYGVKGSKVIGN